ncbi:hypothetical protein VFPBJ_08887 [Purpureocillium lilacinum]|uniref:CCHC-type domain-containing protein n=1 Tax=Purpureocillium lilacinum TaxID=33203 RepID=A0A179GFA5_PURLI|nr:hypothetical protein VFPBJ_08887 [Purpureocillium lilacinum]
MARLLENWGSIHWRDSRPIHAADSHPFMTLDWGNPADTANRRLHLRDFYQYHGVEHGYEQLFDACERDVCKMLRSFGESTLSELKFNYYVDLVVWRRTCKLILNLSHEIPLVLTFRDRFDECGPPSQVYSDFLAKERETASPTRTTTLSATSAEAEATPEVDEHTEEGNAVLEETQGPTSMDLNTAANPQAQQPAKASRRLDTMDHAADSTAERPAKRLRGNEEPIQSPVPDQAEPENCANCGDVSHMLGTCPIPSDRGILYGCPMCNSIEHNINECAEWPSLPIGDKYQFLVLDRGNMPPLATRDSRLWYNVLVAHLQVSPENWPPTIFPWTPAFGRQIAQELASQNGRGHPVSRYRNRWLLPSDPQTRDWPSVQRHFGNVQRVWLF